MPRKGNSMWVTDGHLRQKMFSTAAKLDEWMTNKSTSALIGPIFDQPNPHGVGAPRPLLRHWLGKAPTLPLSHSPLPGCLVHKSHSVFQWHLLSGRGFSHRFGGSLLAPLTKILKGGWEECHMMRKQKWTQHVGTSFTNRQGCGHNVTST